MFLPCRGNTATSSGQAYGWDRVSFRTNHVCIKVFCVLEKKVILTNFLPQKTIENIFDHHKYEILFSIC